MAKIQILEISPAETPMEDLTYDVTSDITGGGFVQDLLADLSELVDDVLGGARDLLLALFGTGNEDLIDDAL